MTTMKYRRISNIKSKRVKRVKRSKKIRKKRKKRTAKRNKKRTKSRHVGGASCCGARQSAEPRRPRRPSRPEPVGVSRALSEMVYNGLAVDPKTELFSGGTNKDDLVIISGHGSGDQEYFVIPDNIDLYHYVGDGDSLSIFHWSDEGYRTLPNTKREIEDLIALMEEEINTIDEATRICDEEIERIVNLPYPDSASGVSTLFTGKEWTDIRSKLMEQISNNVKILNDARRDSPPTTPNYLQQVLDNLSMADEDDTNEVTRGGCLYIKGTLLIWLKRIKDEKVKAESFLQYKKNLYILKYSRGGLCRDYTINFDMTWRRDPESGKKPRWAYSGLLTSDQFGDEVSGMQVKDYIDRVVRTHRDPPLGEWTPDEWRRNKTENMISKHNDNIMSRSDVRKSVVEENRFKLSELIKKISDYAGDEERIKVVGCFCRSIRGMNSLLKEACTSWGNGIGLVNRLQVDSLEDMFKGNIEYEGVSDELMRQQSLASNSIAQNFKGIVEELNRLRPGLTTTLSLGSEDDRIFEELIQKMNEGGSLSHEYACYIFDMIRKLELGGIITN